MAINTSYANTLDYSVLFDSYNQYNDFKSTYKSSSSSAYDFYESIYGYGVNSADTLSEKAQSFLTGAKEYSNKLLENIANLAGSSKKASVFDKKTAVSDDTDKLSIKSTDSAKMKDFKDLTVEISQIAKSQINTSNSLNAKDKTTLESGTKTIEITTADGKTTKINFKVNSTDTNEDVNKKIASAINEKGIGVSAKVTTKDGKTTISMESTKTGIQSEYRDNFTVKDITGGNVVSGLGLNNKEQEAQDAKYRIGGGKEQTSKTNDVDLGSGVAATLKDKTGNDKDVNVSFKESTTLAINEVRDLINNFNGLLDLANQNKNDKKSANLANELNGLSKTYLAALKRLGIEKNGDGYLEINEDKMKAAAEDKSLRDFFKPKTGYQNFGFSHGLSRVSSNVSNNPARYVTTNQTGQGTLSFSQTAKYESILGMGLLFNSYY